MRRIIVVISLCLAASAMSACAFFAFVPVVGTAYGGYETWRGSKAVKYYSSDLHTVYLAVKRSCEQMKLETRIHDPVPQKEYSLEMGWVKSYIYSFSSVGIYVDLGASPAMVRSGVFQWIRAGWSGINFVQTEHVIKGMKRHVKNLKTILESPKLPAPDEIVSVYQRLSALPQKDLVKKYTALQKARQALAVQSGKIKTDEIRQQDSSSKTSKEQIIEELMLEYLKITLGKQSLLEKKVILGINEFAISQLEYGAA